MKVLITDGNRIQTLAIVRSLGEKGISVEVGAETRPSLAGSSKYAKGSFVYPSPIKEPLAFIHTIKKRLVQEEFDILLCVTEPVVWLCSLNRAELGKYTKMPLPDHEAIRSFFDKESTIKLAEQHGVQVPKTYVLKDIDETIHNAKDLSFPLIVKPRFKHFWDGTKFIPMGRVGYCFSMEELIRILECRDPRLPLPLIQEFIPGKGIGIFFLMSDLEPYAVFAHQRIREIYPTGGSSSLRESMPLDCHINELALRILRAVNWYGVAMVEFKLDSRDNMPKLMEVNGRFWGSLQLSIISGVDFPYLLCRLIMGSNVKPVTDYQIGVKCRWLLGDFFHLFNVFKGKPKYWSYEFPSRLFTLRMFIRSFFEKKMYYDVYSLKDPKPAFIEPITCRR